MKILQSGDISEQVTQLVSTQVRNLFLCEPREQELLTAAVPDALSVAFSCFRGIANKYYWDENGNPTFSPYHSGQYAIFLYHLARVVWKSHHHRQLADKVYYLNKTLNGLDLYYEVEMPACFFLEHPVGSVIGRAQLGNYLVVQQNCTIGGNRGAYPVFGDFVWLFASSCVIGESAIGNNVFIAAGTMVKDEDVPDNSLVFGRSPDLVIKQRAPSFFFEKSPFVEHC